MPGMNPSNVRMTLIQKCLPRPTYRNTPRGGNITANIILSKSPNMLSGVRSKGILFSIECSFINQPRCCISADLHRAQSSIHEVACLIHNQPSGPVTSVRWITQLLKHRQACRCPEKNSALCETERTGRPSIRHHDIGCSKERHHAHSSAQSEESHRQRGLPPLYRSKHVAPALVPPYECGQPLWDCILQVTPAAVPDQGYEPIRPRGSA